jgi:Heterokaryon incompatibility protein (HET)
MSRYRYSSLPEGSIRLLRLMPHHGEDAFIQCQLLDFPLLESAKGTHPYEALSYVWGSPENPRPILIDGYDLTVTANLHVALSHLRDRFVERLLWVDAICINQEDLKERERQVQSMAKVYAKATRVVVWLGEGTIDSNQALDQIRAAAEEQSTRSETSKTAQQPILTLLQRPWFQRIWVRDQTSNNTGRDY